MHSRRTPSNEPREVALLVETTLTVSRNMLRGIRRYMSEHQNWTVILETGQCAPEWLSHWSGHGIISRSWSQEMLDMIIASGLPAVEMRTSQLKHRLPFVGVDNRLVGALVAKHFLDRGFHHFGCFAIEVEAFVEERANSFARTVAEHGFRCDNFRQPELKTKSRPTPANQSELIDWLLQLPKPCGILAGIDRFGCAILDACRKAGIAVPEEVAVVGVGDDESLCEMSSPPLSSVHIAAAKIGYEAASLLDHLMGGGKPPRERILIPPIGVTTRKSSDIVAVEDRVISKALRLIRERAVEGLTVDDVATATGVSRRTLERKMDQAIGRSPQEELVRVKLALTRELLAETNLSLKEICERAGFSHVQHLARLFRKHFDTTLSQYRKAVQINVPS